MCSHSERKRTRYEPHSNDAFDPKHMLSAMRRLLFGIFRTLPSALAEIAFASASALAIVSRTTQYIRWLLLRSIAETRFNIGLMDSAERLSAELVRDSARFRDDWNFGNAIHHGNLLLGRIALRRGHVVLASEFLIAAGRTPGSPQLDSFGPNMRLAQELLGVGNQQVVLDYLRLCRTFWDPEFSQLDIWVTQIQSGENPNFGTNLHY